MKRIFFKEAKFKSWTTVIVLLCLTLIIVGCFRNFEMFGLQNYNITRFFWPAGGLIQFTFTTRIFWFKNYVEWNKRNISIKLNNFLMETIAFEKISTVVVDDAAKTLKILLNSGREKVFKTDNIIQNDLKILVTILKRLK